MEDVWFRSLFYHFKKMLETCWHPEGTPEVMPEARAAEPQGAVAPEAMLEASAAEPQAAVAPEAMPEARVAEPHAAVVVGGGVVVVVVVVVVSDAVVVDIVVVAVVAIVVTLVVGVSFVVLATFCFCFSVLRSLVNEEPGLMLHMPTAKLP